ncbi:MAG: hypothetical protein Fur005_18410 [Roseiflexaceae bacterium]
MHAPSFPALAAVARYPGLYAQVSASIEAQYQRANARVLRSLPRPDQLALLYETISQVTGGVIAIEAQPGAGATTLLCQLAASQPATLWLPSDDLGQGLEALCAQIIALHDLPVALVPPAAQRDSTTLERLLAEAVATRDMSEPLLVLIDDLHADRAAPRHPPFPLSIPAGVVVIAVVAHGAALPQRPVVRMMLPDSGPVVQAQIAATIAGRCEPLQAQAIALHAHGSFLYAQIAADLLAAQQLSLATLPDGLDALYRSWWESLDAIDQQIFTLLAAAAEPLDLAYLVSLVANQSPETIGARLGRWRPLLDWHDQRIALHHHATALAITQLAPRMLEAAHVSHARLLHAQAEFGRGNAPDEYLVRQTSRHTSLCDTATRQLLAPVIERRAWIVSQERRTGAMRAAAHDLGWALRAAVLDGPALRMVRAAALAGTLTLLARTIAPDAPSAALTASLERGGARDQILRRARNLVDQLPDGRDKAQALRRLGETCYALRMRASAMRMLSEALDLEGQGLPRSWRHEREEVLVALARAATHAGSPNIALGITTLILHPERRGLIETEVVRYLIAHHDYTRAEEVAIAIGHAGTHEWAVAEVAVAHSRAGDTERSAIVLATLRTETAIAWAQTELACDAVRRGEKGIPAAVLQIDNDALRDRALAQVALAQAQQSHVSVACAIAARIHDTEIRARTLIGVAEAAPANADAALHEANELIATVQGEERATLVSALAAAHASTGWLDRALQTAETLPPGEERDRAQARIAVALARCGDELAAHNVTMGIDDDDERAWALDELARQVASSGQWAQALGLAAQIANADQRARTEADIVIAWSRAGQPVDAHDHAVQIANTNERVRALAAIAPALAAAGLAQIARPSLARITIPDLRSRYQSALAAAHASCGDFDGAQALIVQIGRPTERARALIALTRAAAQADRALALRALGEALLTVTHLGRSETLACIAQAAEALALIGGPELLLGVASELDEIDGWWV